MGYEKRVHKASGAIFVRVTVGHENGKRVRVSQSFPKGTDENTILLWVLQTKAKGIPEKPKPVMFDELLDEWLVYKRPQIAVKTFKIYKLSCNAYLRGKLGELSEITPRDIQTLIDNYSHLSARSQELIKTYARMAFDYAVMSGYLESSPVTKAVVIPKRRRKRKIQVFTTKQFERLSEGLDVGSKVEIALRTLLLSGLRVSEVLALEPRHVSDTALTVEQSLESRYGVRKPTPPKSDHAYRTVTIPKDLVEQVRSAASEPFVFPVGYTCLRDNISKVCERLELPQSTLHGLRHSHCTYLLAKGVNIIAVSKRLGHHSPAFTLSVYGHLVPSMDEKVLEVLG